MIRRAMGGLGAVLVAGSLFTPVAAASPSRAGQAAGDPRLTLLDQPIAVAPDGDFTVFLAIDDAPDATEIAIDIYDRVEPGEVVGAEPDEDPDATFGPLPLAPEDRGAQRTIPFTIQLFTEGEPNPDPAWGWRIDEPGVYPIRIRLQDVEGTRDDVMMTSLIRLPGPDQQVTQTEAALMVAVHRPPPADPDDRVTTDQADEALLDELEPLLTELFARPDLPATFSITPDTVARIAGDPEAADELGQLRRVLATDGRPLLDAPYVDIDAASLVQANLPDLLSLERDLGRTTLSELLEPPTAGTWQLQDRVDDATLDELRNRGIFRTLVPSNALAATAGVLAPVDLPAGDGEVRAVAQSNQFALGLTATDDPILAAHRLLGRLASTGPGPTGTPGVVVTIDPDTVAAESLQIVGDALAFGSPFFRSTTVNDLLDAAPDPARTELLEPSDVALGSYPLRVRQAQTSLDSYRSMVGARPDLIAPYEVTLAVSGAADLDLAQRQQDAASVQSGLQEPFTAISIPAKDSVTLGARNAQFPLGIESTLDYPVKVVIQLESNDRLDFPSNRIEATVEPGRQVVTIQVRTRTAGNTPVRITVRSPDDGVTLAEGQYTIRSTAVSGVGILLTIGAALFLVLWWGRHWHRTRKARKAERDDRAVDQPSDPPVDRESSPTV